MVSRFFFDTEFLVASSPGHASYHLISLGIAAEDGRELYLENSLFDWAGPGVDPWLLTNVRPHLHGPGSDASCPPAEMARRVAAFVAGSPEPQFWAYNGASDWVVLVSLYGDLLRRPEGWPSGYRELKHHLEDRGLGKADRPAQDGQEHHALADARWNRDCFIAAAAL